jgi:hypothetical protein
VSENLEPMDPAIAKALEGLIGPLVAAGMRLPLAERIAKVRAFNRGDYQGEPCEKCGTYEALLYPWRDEWSTVNLCHACLGRSAVVRQQEKMARAGGVE